MFSPVHGSPQPLAPLPRVPILVLQPSPFLCVTPPEQNFLGAMLIHHLRCSRVPFCYHRRIVPRRAVPHTCQAGQNRPLPFRTPLPHLLEVLEGVILGVGGQLRRVVRFDPHVDLVATQWARAIVLQCVYRTSCVERVVASEELNGADLR